MHLIMLYAVLKDIWCSQSKMAGLVW